MKKHKTIIPPASRKPRTRPHCPPVQTQEENQSPVVDIIQPEIKTKVPLKKNPVSNKQLHGATSIVQQINPTMVQKKIRYFHETFDREVFWLSYLNSKNYPWCPRMHSNDKRTFTIVMDYAGERITKANAPPDWESQLQTILQDLKTEGIKHNDIKATEILVKDNKLYLIDYGWCSKGDDLSCGGKIRGYKVKPSHHFGDETAIDRIRRALH